MSNTANIAELFKTAEEEGSLSPVSAHTLKIVDVGNQIKAALGVKVDDIKASEVTLVTMLIDDSGSIRFALNTEIVRDGHNLVLDALSESKQENSILAHTRYLNGKILFPYCPVGQAIRMDEHNYNPNLGTPLYDESVVALGTVLAKTQEFSDNGVVVRSVTLIVSDGADEHSRRATAKSVADIVRDMLKSEIHIVAAMGIDDGGRTDFRQIFKEMGIRDEWILTPSNTKSEMRKAFQLFSKSAVRASQSARVFSQLALGGGFANP